MVSELTDEILRLPHRFLYWIRLRYWLKAHILGYQPYRGYTDLYQNVIECNFKGLVDYVEIELAEAWERGQGNVGWFRKYFPKRNPEAGLAHLNWAMGLVEEDPTGKPINGMFTAQAKGARAIKEVYEYATKGRTAILVAQNDAACMWADDPPKRVSEYNSLEDKLYRQDTKYLTKLIKNRSHLWA